jgi:hypothetical protein
VGLLRSDDTPMKVLSLMEERERAEAGGVKPTIKAIKTSGIESTPYCTSICGLTKHQPNDVS